MARLTLTPTNFPGTGGAVLPASGTVLTGFTGVQFANNGQMALLVYVGSAGAGNVTETFGRKIEGEAPAAVVTAVSNSTNYWFGAWSPTDFTQQDGSGMTFVDFSVVTGNSVTLYQLSPLT